MYFIPGTVFWRKNNTYSLIKTLFQDQFQFTRITQQKRSYNIVLTPHQIAKILRKPETTLDGRVMGKFPVRGFDSNQLEANNPIEDRRSVARVLSNNASVFGVFDGHAGPACAQAISERLFDYIAVSLMSDKELEKFVHDIKEKKSVSLLQSYSFLNHYFTRELDMVYRSSLQKFAIETLSTHIGGLDDTDMSKSEKLARALKQLDHDFLYEATPIMGGVNYDAIEVGFSGSCATVLYFEDMYLHVANVGDCRAVLGRQDRSGEWVSKRLSNDHNVKNKKEIERIKSSHPLYEHDTLFENERLLGQLVPLRAFGDMQFKLDINDLQTIVNVPNSNYSENVIPRHHRRFKSAPYLTAEPEMHHYTLDSCDRFIVLATDGLWDKLSEEDVVKLVGEHMESHLQIRFDFDKGMNLRAVNNMLLRRKHHFTKPEDRNAATHLIRHALGFDTKDVTRMLMLPVNERRIERDDMTVIVIYLDNKFLQMHG